MLQKKKCPICKKMSLRLSGNNKGWFMWDCQIGDHMFTMEELEVLRKNDRG